MIESFSQLESVLLAMKDGVVLLDQNKGIIFLNNAAKYLLNTSTEGFESYNLLPKVVQDLAEEILVDSMQSDREVEISINGETIYLQVHAQLFIPSDSVDTKFSKRNVLIVMHDITRIHRLENLRREFVANVSHELKTPITSIKAAVETLQDGASEDAEVMPRFLDIIARQSDRLNNIIEDLLGLARIENESDEFYLSEGIIYEAIGEAIASCELKASQKQIDIKLDCPKNLIVRMNSTLLEQAIVNLVDNAIKYSDSGTVICVGVRNVGKEVEISVKDQGCGISPEHFPRIFERFYRVDKARSRHAGGSGLGLSIVKHIAQVHGGRATVTSILGKGSTFSLFLAANHKSLHSIETMQQANQ